MMVVGPAGIAVKLILLIHYGTALETRRDDGGFNSTACPIDLLDVTASESLQLHEDGLRYLAQLPSPVYLVPMLGVYRGGKSMLLCRLMRLRSPYSNGFGIGHGQHTFTRGIQICAEEVSGLGTVVWMDTEGLFSAEDAAGAYGPKIFSFALLFSSVVMVNSVKVLNDQFFAFFAEQQRIARVLKHGLVSQGLPVEALMPANLSVFWVIQQPVQFHNSSEASKRQLEDFLSKPGDETRARVHRDFHHTVHEVPTATYDARLWSSLDSVPDDELATAYVIAAEELRSRVLSEIPTARPMHSTGIVKQLEMFLQVVQTQNFSGTLAREVFEEAEIGSLCRNFSVAAEKAAGQLPVPSLEPAFKTARQAIEKQRMAAMDSYHFDQTWLGRLETGLQDEVTKLDQRNAATLLSKWQSDARKVAEDKACFFLGRQVSLLEEFEANYSHSFAGSIRTHALDFAYSLQRARLGDCIVLWDVLKPFFPWLAWPVCKGYLQTGLFSGFVALILHAVMATGIYGMLRILNQIPDYLDINYPVLRIHPILLDVLLQVPPTMPWGSLVQLFGLMGAARSAWKFISFLLFGGRRGVGRSGTIVPAHIEEKLDILLKCSTAAMKQRLIAAALDAADVLERGHTNLAAVTLLKALCHVRESSEVELATTIFSEEQLQRVRIALEQLRISPSRLRTRISDHHLEHNLTEVACCGSAADLLDSMLDLFELMTSGCCNSESRSHEASRNSSPTASGSQENSAILENSCNECMSPVPCWRSDVEDCTPASKDAEQANQSIDRSFLSSSTRSVERSRMLDEAQICEDTSNDREASSELSLACRGKNCMACRFLQGFSNAQSRIASRGEMEHQSPEVDRSFQDDQSHPDSELSCQESCISASPEGARLRANRLQWKSPHSRTSTTSVANSEVSQSSSTSVMQSPTPFSHLRGRTFGWQTVRLLRR